MWLASHWCTVEGELFISAVTATRRSQLNDSMLESRKTGTGRPCNLRKKSCMDSSNLFSHPEAPEFVRSGEASTEPVEHPAFSDKPSRNQT